MWYYLNMWQESRHKEIRSMYSPICPRSDFSSLFIFINPVTSIFCSREVGFPDVVVLITFCQEKKLMLHYPITTVSAESVSSRQPCLSVYPFDNENTFILTT